MMKAPPYPHHEQHMSREEYEAEIIKWAEAVKAMGKNPHLYEPLGFVSVGKPYIPKTPEEKAEHDEFVRKTREYLERIAQEQQRSTTK